MKDVRRRVPCDASISHPLFCFFLRICTLTLFRYSNPILDLAAIVILFHFPCVQTAPTHKPTNSERFRSLSVVDRLHGVQPNSSPFCFFPAFPHACHFRSVLCCCCCWFFSLALERVCACLSCALHWVSCGSILAQPITVLRVAELDAPALGAGQIGIRTQHAREEDARAPRRNVPHFTYDRR